MFLSGLPAALLPWTIVSAKLSRPVSACCIIVCGLLKQKAGHFESYRPSMSTAEGSGKSNLHFNTGSCVSGVSLLLELPEGRSRALLSRLTPP